MEYRIEATELVEKLDNVLQAIQNERASYIIGVSGRPKAVIISLEDYQTTARYQQERHEFFERLDEMAKANAEYNADMTEEEVLALIEQARQEVYEMELAKKA